MGAQEFDCVGHGSTIQEAFNAAKQEALYDHGHSGYSGTIAEKDSFRKIPCEINSTAIQNKIDACMQDENHFIQDKWGPAGAIKLSDTSWVFFGYASS